MNASDISSSDFVIKRFFMKLFQTNHIDTIKHCLQIFNFQLTTALIPERANKVDIKHSPVTIMVNKDEYNCLCKTSSRLNTYI